MWSLKLSIQLNLVHVARKKNIKRRNYNKRQCPFISVQVKIREGSPEDGSSRRVHNYQNA